MGQMRVFSEEEKNCQCAAPLADTLGIGLILIAQATRSRSTKTQKEKATFQFHPPSNQHSTLGMYPIVLALLFKQLGSSLRYSQSSRLGYFSITHFLYLTIWT